MNRRENAVETLFPTVSEVPETVTGTQPRARQTKPLFKLQNTHPSLLPRNAPRLPRAPIQLPRTPSERPVVPPVDRATRRASSDASRSREKKHLHLRKQKALANADADADDDDAGVFDRPPSTRPHDLRASPDDEAKHAFRGTCRGTCADRSESERERSGEFESRSKAAETRRSSKSSRAHIRLDRADRMTSASSRASARARSISLWIDVPAPATGSADRERLDSVTLSIWPCVFVVRERASATGATRVSNAKRKRTQEMARVRFSKSRSRNSGRARARSARRAPRRTCAPARSTDLPGLRRSCSRLDAIAISQRGRGWDGRGGETRGGDARANRVFKAEREK